MDTARLQAEIAAVKLRAAYQRVGLDRRASDGAMYLASPQLSLLLQWSRAVGLCHDVDVSTEGIVLACAEFIEIACLLVYCRLAQFRPLVSSFDPLCLGVQLQLLLLGRTGPMRACAPLPPGAAGFGRRRHQDHHHRGRVQHGS